MKRETLIWLILLVIVILSGVVLIFVQLNQPKIMPELINPSFESGLDGWESTGVQQEEGRDSAFRLTHASGLNETLQTLTNVPNGWITLSVWVHSDGYDTNGTISLKDCGSEIVSAAVPVGWADWMNIVVSAKVTSHQCTIVLASDNPVEQWISFDDIELVQGRAALSVMGADISSLKKSEEKGGLYYDENGKQDDALQILKDHGMNYARLRVWVNSPDGYHGKEQLLAIANRLKDKNIKLLVDFHYSDTWADPGKQPKPASWENLDFEGVKQALYDHTFDVVKSLVDQGTPPDMVQIGNEINNGMVWPDGKNDKDFVKLAELLKSGIQAVHDASPDTKIMLHIAEGGKNDIFRWWFDAILEQGVEFDVIGVSYYPYWHGTLAAFQENLNDIAVRYEKDIIVVETAYPFTTKNDDSMANNVDIQGIHAYQATPEGQARMLADIMMVIRGVPNGHGLGFFWWDATWTAVPGNGWDPANNLSGNNWENQALFDFDDKPLPAMSLFGHP